MVTAAAPDDLAPVPFLEAAVDTPAPDLPGTVLADEDVLASAWRSHGVPMLKFIRLAMAAALVLVPGLVAAQTGEHHGPPAEAIAACKDKAEGVSCAFDGPRGHRDGACHKVESGDMACVHPHHHHDKGTQ